MSQAEFKLFQTTIKGLIARGHYGQAKTHLVQALNDIRLNDNVLLWLGILGLKSNQPFLSEASLSQLMLQWQSMEPLKLMEQVLEIGDHCEAAAAFACWLYEADPTDIKSLKHHLTYLFRTSSDREPGISLLKRHAPHLRESKVLRSMAGLLVQGLGLPSGAVWQAEDRLYGWCLVAAGSGAPTLVFRADQKRVVFQPRRQIPLGEQDSWWFELALQGRAKTLTVELEGQPLIGSPLVWQPVQHPNLSADSVPEFDPPVSGVKIIIPVYKGYEATLRCLNSVLTSRQYNRVTFKVMVINDASPEPMLVEQLQSLAGQGLFELIEQPVNQGFIGAVNHGLAHSLGQDVILLNADTRVNGNWVDRLQAAAYRHPRVASVTPLSNHGELMSLLSPCQSMEIPPDEQLQKLDRIAARVNANQDVPLATGCGFCLYLRRAALMEVGGLDPQLVRGYGEESDWCYRAAAKGWSHRGAVDVFVGHEGGLSFGDEKRLRVKQNLAILEKRHPHSEREFTACLERNPTLEVRQRLLRHWLKEEAVESPLLPVYPSAAHARRSGTPLALVPQTGKRQALRLMGKHPLQWQLDYRLPQDQQVLEQDLHTLGVEALCPLGRELPPLVAAALPDWPQACLWPVEPLPALPPHREDVVKSPLIAVVGQPESFQQPLLLALARLLAAAAAPVYLLPLRHLRETQRTLISTGQVFPLGLLETDQWELAELWRQHMPLAAVLLLDDDPATLAEAAWLERPWLVPRSLGVRLSKRSLVRQVLYLLPDHSTEMLCQALLSLVHPELDNNPHPKEDAHVASGY